VRSSSTGVPLDPDPDPDPDAVEVASSSTPVIMEDILLRSASSDTGVDIV